MRTLAIIGSTKTITVSGTSFQFAFGMRSNYFTVAGAPVPGSSPIVIGPAPAYATFPRTYSSASRADLLVVTSAGYAVRYPVTAGRIGSGQAIPSGLSGYTPW